MRVNSNPLECQAAADQVVGAIKALNKTLLRASKLGLVIRLTPVLSEKPSAEVLDDVQRINVEALRPLGSDN